MNEDTLNHPEMQPVKYYGLYRGELMKRNDPLQIGRCKVFVHQVYHGIGVDDLPWAWPMLPAGIKGSGMVWIPPLGSNVWVQFEMGDPNHPVWCQGWWAAPSGAPETPGNMTVGDNNPDNYILETPKGNRIELDDRDGQEAISIKDKAGNYIRVDTANKRISVSGDGELVIQVVGKANISSKDLSIVVTDKGSVTISGDASITVGGNACITATGDMLVNGSGNATVTAGGNATVDAGKNTFISGKQVTVSGALMAEIGAVGMVTVKSNSMVKIFAPIIMEN